VHLSRDYVQATSLNYGAGAPSLKSREAREDNDRRLCCSKTGQHCTDLDRSHVRSLRSSGSTAKLMKGQGVGTQLDLASASCSPRLNFIPNNLTMFSCRAGHSRFRHLLADFGECRFSRLFLVFLFIHSFHDVTSANRSQVNLDRGALLWRSVCFGVFVPQPLSHSEL
jgi:hypothetical protein